eukprot:c18644_g1_i2.p1 GENE.c18644_g1_i2~~c18644_g1_i2.p1  ORF type:complete len:483 (+),score=179.39 c18644_g1_i2:31-1449(+)
MELKTSLKIIFLAIVWLGCVFIPIYFEKEESPSTGRHLSENNQWTKPLFTDVGSDIFGSFLALIAVTVGAGGGIGGGGLLVPVYFLVLNLGRFSIPLSKATIFGSSITHVMLSLYQKHPKVDRPLIAFDVSMMLEPMTLGGSVIGVLLNTIFPTWLITLCLIILLAITTQITFAKGLKTWKKESLQAENKEGRSRVPSAVIDSENASLGLVASANAEHTLETGDVASKERQINKFLQRERKVPYDMLVLSFLTWVVIFILSLLKGGHGAPSVAGIACGSGGFWVTNILSILSMALITKITGDYLHKIFLKKKEIGYQFIEGDVHWDEKNCLHFPALCTFAGVSAGLLGIGGGMVKGPLMLHMGVNPEVSAATSGFMIFFTSSATTMQFIILGMLRFDYTVWYGTIGLIGGILGKKIVEVLIKKYARPSIVIFILALIIGASCVLMGVSGIVDVVNSANEGRTSDFQFNELCT